MAEKNETIESVKTNETVEEAKSTAKKIATGNTKKVVQKRASSVAGRGTTKKADTAKTSKTTKTNSKAGTKNTKTNATIEKKATSKKVNEKVEVEETMPEKETAQKATKKTAVAKKENTAKKESEKDTTKKSDKSSSKKVAKKEKKSNKNSKTEELLDKEVEEKVSEGEVEKGKVEDKKENRKEDNKKLQKKSKEEIEEAVAQEIKANKKLPASEFGKINSRVFPNIILAVVIMAYLDFIVLGFMNIENPVFITDLKVFSIALLAVSIGVFEYAYKKDSGRHTIHGVEILMLAFATMAFIYVNLMCADKFVYIVAFITYAFAIYYVAKSIIVYNRMKKEYFVNEMKEIIKK